MTSSGRSSRLPQQNQIESLRGRGQTGERKAVAFVARQLAHKLLERRMARQDLETGRGLAGWVTVFRLRAASENLFHHVGGGISGFQRHASTRPPAASTSSRPAMKWAQSAPLISTSGSTAAISSRGVSSSNSVTASTASRPHASSARSSSRNKGPRWAFQPLHAGIGVQCENQKSPSERACSSSRM